MEQDKVLVPLPLPEYQPTPPTPPSSPADFAVAVAVVVETVSKSKRKIRVDDVGEEEEQTTMVCDDEEGEELRESSIMPEEEAQASKKRTMTVQRPRAFATLADALRAGRDARELRIGGFHIVSIAEMSEDAEEALVREFSNGLSFNFEQTLPILRHLDLLAGRMLPVCNNMLFYSVRFAVINSDGLRGCMYMLDESKVTKFGLVGCGMMDEDGHKRSLPLEQVSMPALKNEFAWWGWLAVVAPDFHMLMTGGHARQDDIMPPRLSGARIHAHIMGHIAISPKAHVDVDDDEAAKIKRDGYPFSYTIDMTTDLWQCEPKQLWDERWRDSEKDKWSQGRWRSDPFFDPRAHAFHPDMHSWLMLAPFLRILDQVIGQYHFRPEDVQPVFLSVTFSESAGLEKSDLQNKIDRNGVDETIKHGAIECTPIIPVAILHEMLLQLVESESPIGLMTEYLYRIMLQQTMQRWNEPDTYTWRYKNLVLREVEIQRLMHPRRHVDPLVKSQLLCADEYAYHHMDVAAGAGSVSGGGTGKMEEDDMEDDVTALHTSASAMAYSKSKPRRLSSILRERFPCSPTPPSVYTWAHSMTSSGRDVDGIDPSFSTCGLWRIPSDTSFSDVQAQAPSFTLSPSKLDVNAAAIKANDPAIVFLTSPGVGLVSHVAPTCETVSTSDMVQAAVFGSETC